MPRKIIHRGERGTMATRIVLSVDAKLLTALRKASRAESISASEYTRRVLRERLGLVQED